MVVLDTCAVIEACKPSPSFSKQTQQWMDTEAYVLSISFAEIACKIRLAKLEMSVTPRALFLELSRVTHLHIIDVGVNEWLDSIELDWPENRDPADRIITAFAIQRQLPMVSSDLKIKAFYPQIIW